LLPAAAGVEGSSGRQETSQLALLVNAMFRIQERRE